MSKTKFYRVWKAIKNRCNNPNVESYKDYGGRGIKICERWLESFENFRDDMYESYLEHKKNNNSTTINRINNNGNYEPSNCKWATYLEQTKNKRKSIKPKFYKTELKLCDICKKYFTLFKKCIQCRRTERKKVIPISS